MSIFRPLKRSEPSTSTPFSENNSIESSGSSKKQRTSEESSSSTSPLSSSNFASSSSTMAANASTSFDNEYSRLIAVVGREALLRMQSSSVLLIGVHGLGVEIAKNIVLMGVQKLTLSDQTNAEISDMSSNFFLTNAKVGQNRAVAVADELRKLNQRVLISTHQGDLTEEFLLGFSVVVSTNNTSLTEVLRLSEICHSHNVKFILADSRGLFGAIFSDFGSEHYILDRNGEPPKSSHINWISNENPGIVHCVDTERHDLEDGDWVSISEVEGMSEINQQEFKVKVLNPYSLSIGDTSSYGKYKSRGIIQEVKKPILKSYLSLGEAFQQFDFSKSLHPNGEKLFSMDQFFLFYKTLLAFQEQHDRSCPRPYHSDDLAQFISLARTINDTLTSPLENIDVKLFRQLVYTAAGDINPMAAFLGGVAAQEVMKATTGKYTPLDQWLFFDSLDSVHIPDSDNDIDVSDFAPRHSRYDGQIAVFGARFQEKLANLNYFLVGSGAIGCEMLKNWAMMGIACGPNGRIDVTDMDTIEVSNLNRQFLFRAENVGQPKSAVAAAAAKAMNPDIHIEASTVKVAPETASAYPPSFWERLDGVCNALDNIEARKYVDQLCVRYSKSLLESGTLGPKGNTQVIVPFMTESYSSSADPPQTGIPLCTLQSFPSRIEHTLAWARQIVFESLFVDRMENIRKFYTQPDFVQKLPSVSKRTTATHLEEDLITKRPTNFSDCILWARELFQEYFHNAIIQLLHVFPRDYTDKNGTPFWTGSKRPPAPIVFDVNNQHHLDFIVFATFLRAYCFGLIHSEFKPHDYEESIKKIADEVSKYNPPPFVPKHGFKVETDPNATAPAQNKLADDGDDDEAYVARLLPKLASLPDPHIRVIEFEKDDDRNFHVDFVNAASNLRALAYEIPTVDRLQSKLIAGKIIPAMITTTAAVTGLVVLELYKLFVLPPRTIGQFKNTFFSLAVCSFNQGEPVSASSSSGATYRGKPFTLWDRIDIKRGDLTMGQLFDYFRDEEQIEVDMVGFGQALLYSGWMPPAKQQERRKKRVSEVISEVTGVVFGPEVTSVPLEIMGEDEDGQEITAMPAVYFHFK